MAWKSKKEETKTATENLVQFEGTIDSIRYVGDNGFAILSVTPTDANFGMSFITVVGTLFEPRRNDKLTISGELIEHPRFGLQIKADRIQVILPDTEKGILNLLQSKDFLPGVGQKTAKKLYETFGSKVFDVLENEPEKLLDIKGISKKKLEKIVDCYQEKVDMRNILQFCATYGIPQSQGQKIYVAFGGSATNVLRRNPYIITEPNKGIKGIGFKKADAIAAKLGLPKDSPDRIAHGIFFEVNELAAKKGSTAVSRKSLIEESVKMMELPIEIVESYLDKLLAEANPRILEDELDGKPYIWNYYVYVREHRIAELITHLRDARSSVKMPLDIVRAIDRAETKNKIKLADSQVKALKTTLNNKFSVITGGPGVGKTTITRCLINILEDAGNKVVCAAPTGRAAKRMQEATGHKASTIHRLLEVTTDEDTDGCCFKRNADNPLMGDAFIFDESSMIDNYLMFCLLVAIPKDSMVVFIGDVDQLPSVGVGRILEDMITSKSVVVSRLSTIFRQAATSKIITVAHDVNKGHMPIIENNPTDDFFFLETDDCTRCSHKILKLVEHISAKFGCDPSKDIQVLSPKKGSEVGTARLNMLMQERCNPDVTLFRGRELAKEKQKKNIPLTADDEAFLKANIKTPMIMGKECIFAEGDKVMQIVNNYRKEVYNGEVGTIEAVYPTAKGEDICTVISYPDDNGKERPIGYTRAELFEQVALAYACTIHKSQGSEYPYVIIPMMPTFSIMLQRKLIYTGITRGKKLVVMVGDKESFQRAIDNYFKAVVGTRHTKLKYWLSHPDDMGVVA